MKKITLFLAIGLVILSLSVLYGLQSADFGERPFIDIYQVDDGAIEQGRVWIKFQNGLTAHLDDYKPVQDKEGIILFGIPELDELNKRFLVKKANPLFDSPALSEKFQWRHRMWGFHLWYELHFDSKEDIRDIVISYRKLEQVLSWAEPEYKKVLIYDSPAENEAGEFVNRWTPNDPRFEDQWHYHNVGQENGTMGSDIDLIAAWDIEKGHTDVIVAIIDDGIQFNHPDLAANMWEDIGFNFVDNNANINPGSHGTHVAGTVSAVSNNSVGVAGVAGGSGTGDGVRLMSCQVFRGNSQGGFHLAPIYAADNDAAISQNSWGYGSAGVYNQPVLDAIDYFNLHGGGNVLNGGITIFAAGNDNTTGQFYPACYPGAFSVAATNNQDRKAWYSTYDHWVDISAPGGETTAVSARGVLSTTTNSGYAYFQGTSMACPHASGVAALIISHSHRHGWYIENSDVADILRGSTEDHYHLNQAFIGLLGTGRLNAFNALLEVQDMLFGVMNPRNLSAVPVGTNQIDISWELNNEEDDVIIVWSEDGVFGVPEEGMEYPVGSSILGGGIVLYNGNSTGYQHQGLEPATFYQYKAFSFNVEYIYSSGRIASALTNYEPFLLPFTETFDDSPTIPNFWQVQDNQGSGRVWQVGTINNGLENAYGNYAHVSSGFGFTANADLITPTLNLAPYSEVYVGFIHYFRQFFGLSTATFSYSIDNGESWTPIQSWTNTTTNPAFFDMVIPEVAGEAQVRFKWNYNGSWAYYWCFDELNIFGIPVDFAPPVQFAGQPGNGFVGLSWLPPYVGNPLGYNIYRDGYLINTEIVTALEYIDYDVEPFETYSYYITALYSDGESDPSDILEVTPYAFLSPENLQATVEEADVFLYWDEPEIPRFRGEGSFRARKNSILREDPSIHLLGYNIHRDNEVINPELIVTNEYADTGLASGTYHYYVVAVYAEGESEPSNEVEVKILLDAEEDHITPLVTELHGNRPNPFNPETTISFTLQQAGRVSLQVFNIKGQRVVTLLDGHVEEGFHQIRWNGKMDLGKEAGSGIYFYRLTSSEGYSAVRKMIMIK